MTRTDLKDADVHVHTSSQKYCDSNGDTDVMPTICANYSSPNIYKANKSHSSWLAEKSYSSNRLPIGLLNPGLLHRRVKANTQLTLHLLQRRGPSPHSINVQERCQVSFAITTVYSQFKYNWNELLLHQLAKPIGTLEAACPAIWQAPLHIWRLQIHKIPSVFSIQDKIQDSHVLKQQCSHRIWVVAP